jgi:hypothetical protein
MRKTSYQPPREHEKSAVQIAGERNYYGAENVPASRSSAAVWSEARKHKAGIPRGGRLACRSACIRNKKI